MSDYIKREDAIDVIFNVRKHKYDEEELIKYPKAALLHGISRGIEALPSADVEEVVRCKDCKYAHLTYDGSCKYCDKWKDDDDTYIEVYHDGNHYCSYGERKDD